MKNCWYGWDVSSTTETIRFFPDPDHYVDTGILTELLTEFVPLRDGDSQWRRSVVKYGCQGQSGQAIKLFQITPYVSDFQTLNNPGSWQPVGAAKN